MGHVILRAAAKALNARAGEGSWPTRCVAASFAPSLRHSTTHVQNQAVESVNNVFAVLTDAGAWKHAYLCSIMRLCGRPAVMVIARSSPAGFPRVVRLPRIFFLLFFADEVGKKEEKRALERSPKNLIIVMLMTTIKLTQSLIPL